LRIIHRQCFRVDAREILQHTDHSRIIVAEYIELEKVVVDRVEVEMRRLPLCCSIICGILYRREIVYIHVIRNNDDSARMLSRRPFDTRAAQRSEEHTSELQSRLDLVC